MRALFDDSDVMAPDNASGTASVPPMAPAPMIAIHRRTGSSSVPMPSMTTLTVLPGRIDPTPTDVPQAITSPASRVDRAISS